MLKLDINRLPAFKRSILASNECQLTGGVSPASHVNFWPVSARRRQPAHAVELNLGLLGHLQSVVYLNAEIAHRAFELRMPKE